MKMIVYATKNLNRKNAETQVVIAGVYKKRRKVSELIEKRGKELGILDQWDKIAVMDNGVANAGGYCYKYFIINVTEDVPMDLDISSLEAEGE